MRFASENLQRNPERYCHKLPRNEGGFNAPKWHSQGPLNVTLFLHWHFFGLCRCRPPTFTLISTAGLSLIRRVACLQFLRMRE
jgi:hypothetical protein